MFVTLSAVGSFGLVIAMAWLAVAAVMLAVPSRRGRAGWHAGRAAIAMLVSVAALSFGSMQMYRDFGFSSWPEMIEHFRNASPSTR